MNTDPYAKVSSLDEAVARIDEHLKFYRDVSVRGALICMDQDGYNLVTHFQRKLDRVEVSWTSPAGMCLALHDKRTVEGHEVIAHGRVLVLGTTNPRIRLVLSVDPSSFWDRTFLPLIEQCTPRISFPFITSKTIVSLLSSLEHAEVRNFRVTRFSAKSRIEGQRQGRRLRTDQTWTEESLDQILSTLAERRQWLNRVAFKYTLHKNKSFLECDASVTRRCTFRAKIELSWFMRHAYPELLGAATQAMEFYSKRSRTENQDRVPRPIVIEYADPIFREKAQNHRLIQVLGALPGGATSVLHANPYLRASLVDFSDGSSYEIWVLHDRRVIVSPQFRATFASVERVCDHILSRFAEGELKNLADVDD